MSDDTRKTDRVPPDITAPHVVLRPDSQPPEREPGRPIISLLAGALIVVAALCAISLVVWQLAVRGRAEPGDPALPPPLVDLIPTAAPTPEPLPDYPHVSGVTENARQIFQSGQALGNRPDVFSRVGDSISVAPAFLTPIGEGNYDLREHAGLAPAVDYFSQTVARDANSFANTSLAAKGGWSAFTVLNPNAADRTLCLPDETPLACEYRLVRPSIALIMLGTNDVLTTPSAQYESWMQQILDTSVENAVVPVLSTIPEFQRPGGPERVAELNAIITRLARENDVPLVDYHAALEDLPNDGLSTDGVHPSFFTAESSADFTSENLQFGQTVHNLTALQALDLVWRYAIRDG